MATTTKKFLTVSDLAERFERSTGRIRQIALEKEIGTNINSRMRIFSESEAQLIEKHIRNSQKNRKN